MSVFTLQQAYQLAVRRLEAGQWQEAEDICRQILAQQPAQAQTLHLLGRVLHARGRSAEAEHPMRRAAEIDSTRAEYHGNLGVVLAALGRTDQAIAAFQKAIELQPNVPEAHFALGNALKNQGKWGEAIAAYRTALVLRPTYFDARLNLANALLESGEPELAIDEYQQVASLRPESAEVQNNLAKALEKAGQVDAAIAALHQAIALRSDYPEAISNLGNAFFTAGRVEEAVAAYRRALELRPSYADAGHNLLYTLHFHPQADPERLRAEHRHWNEVFARPLAPKSPVYGNSRDLDRRLKVGYVSPDFRAHPVGRFLLPLLEHHDHAAVEVFCYSDVVRPDEVTRRLRASSDEWRDTHAFSDDRLAALVREDRIDLLVDLTMHMAGSRLLAFARKPAPVQVTYLAYASTTGLETIDYRLTDSYLDPPGQNDEYYSERSVRLPKTYWCYPPPEQAPDVSSFSAASTGRITFGCLNNFSKVSASALEAWSRLLLEVPHSQLILHAPQGSPRQRGRELFAQGGVDPERIEFVGRMAGARYFQQYQGIDIALDPFPYGGGTTTCDALWMGVPVVSLAGRIGVSRAGLSLLTNVSLPELVANTPDQYIEIAKNLAGDLPRLAQLRATLRQRMQRSPLMDAPFFARDVEAAYRAMWKTWCERSMLPDGISGT